MEHEYGYGISPTNIKKPLIDPRLRRIKTKCYDTTEKVKKKQLHERKKGRKKKKK